MKSLLLKSTNILQCIRGDQFILFLLGMIFEQESRMRQQSQEVVITELEECENRTFSYKALGPPPLCSAVHPQ